MAEGGGSRRVEQLLRQLILLTQENNKRPIVLDFGNGVLREIGVRVNAENNNK
jgi:hypothetical protein